MNQVKPASPCDVPLIGFGYVRHKRLRPRVHRFVYPTFFLMLPMRTLQRQPLAAGVLAFNRPGILGFRDSDHGDGRGAAQGGALAWLEEVLHAQGIFDADGEICSATHVFWGIASSRLAFGTASAATAVCVQLLPR